MRNSYVLALNDVHIFASHTLLILPVCLNLGFHLHLFVTREHRENIEMCALPGVQYNDEVRGQYLLKWQILLWCNHLGHVQAVFSETINENGIMLCLLTLKLVKEKKIQIFFPFYKPPLFHLFLFPNYKLDVQVGKLNILHKNMVQGSASVPGNHT